MTHHTGHIHGSKLDPFCLPEFRRSGAGLKEYAYYYQKPLRMAAQRKGVGE